jgi:hypothetical protein
MTGTREHQQDEVWYHGAGTGVGDPVITVGDADGQPTGVVRHIVGHSATGMTWGYHGSGPADTPRSLLSAPLGDQARCQDCQGTGKVAYDPEAGGAG